jgi:DNA-directed RNA polymerase specialized sigma24 family protein
MPEGSPVLWAWRIAPRSGLSGDGQLAALRECRGVVQGALGALNKRERSVVELCCLEGLSSKEAATVLGISATTIHNCLVSANGRMESFFADIETSKGGVK